MGKIKRIFCNDMPMTEKDHFTSKLAIIINGAAACCGGSFIGGSYFVGLLNFMGASEVLSNFVLTMATIAGLFMIIVPYITTNLKYKKPFVFICSIFEYMPLALAFFLPYITGKTTTSVIIAAVLFAIHSIVVQMKQPANQELLVNSASAGGGAASFFGLKDGIANGVLIVTYLALGLMTRYFVAEKEGVGYVIMGTIALVMWAISLTFIAIIKEPYKEKKQKVKVNVFKMLKEILKYKPYKQFLIYQIIYIIATYLISSLMPVMNVQRFHLSLEILSYFTVIDLILRAVFCVVFGKLADKIGNKPVVSLALLGFAGNALLYLFMTPDDAYTLKAISIIFCAVANSAICAPAFIYMFECLPKENTSGYIACHNIIVLILATIVGFASATFVDVFEGFSITFLGKTFYEMNLVFALSVILFIAAAIYLWQKHKKEKTI